MNNLFKTIWFLLIWYLIFTIELGKKNKLQNVKYTWLEFDIMF